MKSKSRSGATKTGFTSWDLQDLLTDAHYGRTSKAVAPQQLTLSAGDLADLVVALVLMQQHARDIRRLVLLAPEEVEKLVELRLRLVAALKLPLENSPWGCRDV